MRTIILGLVLAVLFGGRTTAQTLVATIDAKMISCGGTTEFGSDELYLLIHKDGPMGSDNYRLPNYGNDHWSVNPDGLRDILNTWLGEVRLKPGQKAYFDIYLCEKDGGKLNMSISYEGIEVSETVPDSDDFIGGYRVELTNVEGQYINIKWKPIANVWFQTSEQQGPGTAEVHFNGDGSDYGIWFDVSSEAAGY